MNEKHKCKVIAVVNQKGGVGKTTTSINLATALAAIDKKVLIIDFDPQGNASTGFGIQRLQRKTSTYEVMLNKASTEEASIPTEIPNLSIISSTVNLSAAEIELINEIGREFIIKNKLVEALPKYDYIIIDCPPSLGMLTINALTAADSIIIPLQCEFFALEGLSHLLKTVNLVQKKLNPDLKIEGVVLTMYDRRNKLTEQVEADVRNHMKDLVFNTVIPRNVRLSEAPSHGKPVIVYDLNCTGAIAYVNLAKEILQKQKKEVKMNEYA